MKANSAVREPLRRHGIRLTRQRELLFEIIHNAHRHLNADQIYELAKERDPKINRVTIYRTLKVLKQEGLVDELDLLHVDGEQHYYETRLKREHAHIVCLECGSVQEYFGEPLQEMKRQVEADFGFQIEIARTEIGGFCADCQSQKLTATPAEDRAAAQDESGYGLEPEKSSPGRGRRSQTA